MSAEINPEVMKFFNSLGTESDLKDLIGKVKEGLYIEFKKKKHPLKGELDEADGRQFSRALSGFANADGGVLVWGVETNQNACASVLRPIACVEVFTDALKKSIINATQPVVDNVKIETLPGSPIGHGYVKCFIPSSDKTPHRAMLYCREYFKRTTEGFYRLEHFDLEDMFGRRPRPVLEIKHRVERGGVQSGAGTTIHFARIFFELENVGRGSAQAPYVELSATGSLRACGIASSENRLIREVSLDSARRFIGNTDFVIHPGTSYKFAFAEMRFPEGGREFEDFHSSYRVAAINAQLREGTVHITAADLRKKLGLT